jgi:hypothetical protein
MKNSIMNGYRYGENVLKIVFMSSAPGQISVCGSKSSIMDVHDLGVILTDSSAVKIKYKLNTPSDSEYFTYSSLSILTSTKQSSP